MDPVQQRMYQGAYRAGQSIGGAGRDPTLEELFAMLQKTPGASRGKVDSFISGITDATKTEEERRQAAGNVWATMHPLEKRVAERLMQGVQIPGAPQVAPLEQPFMGKQPGATEMAGVMGGAAKGYLPAEQLTYEKFMERTGLEAARYEQQYPGFQAELGRRAKGIAGTQLLDPRAAAAARARETGQYAGAAEFLGPRPAWYEAEKMPIQAMMPGERQTAFEAAKMQLGEYGAQMVELEIANMNTQPIDWIQRLPEQERTNLGLMKTDTGWTAQPIEGVDRDTQMALVNLARMPLPNWGDFPTGEQGKLQLILFGRSAVGAMAAADASQFLRSFLEEPLLAQSKEDAQITLMSLVQWLPLRQVRFLQDVASRPMAREQYRGIVGASTQPAGEGVFGRIGGWLTRK